MFDKSLNRLVSNNDSAFGGSISDSADMGRLEDLDEVLPEKYSDDDDDDYKEEGEVESILNQTSLKLQDSRGQVRVLTKKEEKQRHKSVHRLVTKNGKQRIRMHIGTNLRNRKVLDFFTSFIDYNWFLLAVFITFIYFICWLSFASLWALLDNIIYEGNLTSILIPVSV